MIEAFSQGKYNDAARCEDGWCLTDDFAAVVDGSTSKAAKVYAGSLPKTTAQAKETTGHKAMRTILGCIKDLPTNADMSRAAHLFTEALRAVNTPESTKYPELRCTCSAAIFSKARREVWLFGDCQCRFGGHTYTNPKYVDDVLARIRADVLHYLLAHGRNAEELQKEDLGRAFIYTALREQTGFQNDQNVYNPYRYTVLDGTFIDTTSVPVFPVGDVERVVLSSDGYPVLHDTLAQTETELQRLLQTDPLCIEENVATKGVMHGQSSFDDRTYLSFYST